MVSTTPDRIVTIRLPRNVTDEARQVAEREAETQSSVLRRWLRLGRQVETRAAAGDGR